MSKKIDEYPILKKEVEKKDKVVHLKYVDEVFAGYDPNVIDFIRRCDTLDQAMEILDYLENIGDISTSEGDKLRKRLKTEGLRSFGPKKKKGFYFTRDE
ncbi:MAG: DUF2095 family protein [Candidatus Heimdallarchaeota archaeon]